MLKMNAMETLDARLVKELESLVALPQGPARREKLLGIAADEELVERLGVLLRANEMVASGAFSDRRAEQ